MPNVLQIYKRDDVTYTLNFIDSAGDAINITGYTVFFTVKTLDTDTDASALISKTVTTHSDAAGGESQVSLSASDTDIATGVYIYDFQFKDGSGNIATIVKDKFLVLQDVTVRTS